MHDRHVALPQGVEENCKNPQKIVHGAIVLNAYSDSRTRFTKLQSFGSFGSRNDSPLAKLR